MNLRQKETPDHLKFDRFSTILIINCYITTGHNLSLEQINIIKRRGYPNPYNPTSRGSR